MLQGSRTPSFYYSVLSVVSAEYEMLGGYANIDDAFGLDGNSDNITQYSLKYESFIFLFWTLSLLVITIVLSNIMVYMYLYYMYGIYHDLYSV